MDMATGQAPRRAPTGADNSVLLSRNNLLPPAFWTKGDPPEDALIQKNHLKTKEVD
jgi:hypothetical protein